MSEIYLAFGCCHLVLFFWPLHIGNLFLFFLVLSSVGINLWFSTFKLLTNKESFCAICVCVCCVLTVNLETDKPREMRPTCPIF